MNWPSFNSWTPRTRPLDYDALQNNIGCQPVAGVRVYNLMPFVEVCVVVHDRGLSSPFNNPAVISYFPGPKVTGDDKPVFSWQWAAWVSTAGVRVAHAARISLLSTSLGSKSDLYPSTKPAALSGAFNAKSLMAIAIQKTASLIEVKNHTTSTTWTTATFTGTNPILYLNQLHSSDEGLKLSCYYLKPESPKMLFVRNEEDNFAVEHIAIADSPVDLIALKRIMEKDGMAVLLAVDHFGRDVSLKSAQYPAQPKTGKSALSVAVLSGSYFNAAVIPDAIEEKGSLFVSILSGSVFKSVTTPPTIDTEKSTLSISIESGSYETV